jgi:hypothetical protein
MSSLSSCSKGKTAYEFIQYAARSITAKLENTSTVYDDDHSLGLSDDNSDISEYAISYHDYDDEDFRSDIPRGAASASSINKLSQETRKRLKRDFTTPIKVGIKPTLVGDVYAHCYSIFALPLCAKALGMPLDTLEAWGFTPTDHIILLIRLNGGYPTLDQFLNPGKKAGLVQFRLGKCKKTKPSLATAKLAFDESQYVVKASSTAGPLPVTKRPGTQQPQMTSLVRMCVHQSTIYWKTIFRHWSASVGIRP